MRQSKNLINIILLILTIFLAYITIYMPFYFSEKNNKEDIIVDTTMKKKEEEKIFDLYNDDSITKFVSNKVSFNDKKYIPKNLTVIKSTFLNDNWKLLSTHMQENLLQMWEKFSRHFWQNLEIVSWYRSYDYQKWIKDRWCIDRFCAKAWHSEHQSGLALDIFETTTKQEFLSKPKYAQYYDWLDKNAHKYWFINTYIRWYEIDWYDEEPWHWRYVWPELASILKKKNLSFAQYYNLKNKDNDISWK